jgi:hypothetical protein
MRGVGKLQASSDYQLGYGHLRKVLLSNAFEIQSQEILYRENTIVMRFEANGAQLSPWRTLSDSDGCGKSTISPLKIIACKQNILKYSNSNRKS